MEMNGIKQYYMLLILGLLLSLIAGCSQSQQIKNNSDMTFEKAKDDKEWREILTPFQYDVLREGATERPFTGAYYNTKDTGTYFCVACGKQLFGSDTKFDSGCGWPSFFEPSSKESIVYREDNSLGMKRTEVLCGACGGHLGHVFNDGPPPTGLRYCINSAALRFEKRDEDTK
jgi:peptide-methionine (R)-S-oxide reductase